MNRIGKQPARGAPFQHQIAHHAHELGVAPLVEADDRFDRHAGKYAFDDHLIVDRFVEMIGRVWRAKCSPRAPDAVYVVEQGAWYGWPDFIGGRPVTDPAFKPQHGPIRSRPANKP